jgi:hypothetical protein
VLKEGKMVCIRRVTNRKRMYFYDINKHFVWPDLCQNLKNSSTYHKNTTTPKNSFKNARVLKKNRPAAIFYASHRRQAKLPLTGNFFYRILLKAKKTKKKASKLPRIS